MESSTDIIVTAQNVFDVVITSTTFLFLVAFLAIYIVVLFADIVLLFILRSVRGDLKKGRYGTKERPLASTRTIKKRWQKIESRLSSNLSSEYKLALLEADAFTGEMLAEMGYEGVDTGSRLDIVRPGHFASLESLREAHEIHNRIVLDRDYAVDRSEANRVLSLYRAFFEEAELIV